MLRQSLSPASASGGRATFWASQLSVLLRQRRLALAFLFCVGCLNGGLWIALHPQPIVEGTDATWHHRLALNLAEGNGFSLASAPPFEPTMYREPGYPLFIAIVYRLAGPNPDTVALVQGALLGLLAGLVFLLASAIVGGRLVPLLAGLLTGLSPDGGEMARQLLTEALFTPFFVFVLLFGLRARRTGQGRWYLATGFGFGLAALVRVQAALLLLPVLACWGWQEWRESRRVAGRELALLGLGFALVTLPWFVRNLATFGVPSLAQRYGAALAPRGAKAAYPIEFYATWTVDAAWVALNPWSHLAYPIERFQYGRNYWDNEIWDYHTTLSARITALVADACGRRRREPEALAKAAAALPLPRETQPPDVSYQARHEGCALQFGLDLVRAYPLQYLLQTPFEWVKLNFYPLPSKLAAYRNTMIWLALFTLAWLLATRRLRGDSLWLGYVLFGFNLVAVPFDTRERYIIPALPLYAIFAAVGVAQVTQALASRFAVFQTPGQGRGGAATAEVRS